MVDPVNNTISSGSAKMIMDTVSGKTTFDSLAGGVAQITAPIVIDPNNGTITRGPATANRG